MESSKPILYDHLRTIELPLDVLDLARIVVNTNYGTQQFLLALIIARREKYVNDGLSDRIEKMVREDGYY